MLIQFLPLNIKEGYTNYTLRIKKTKGTIEKSR